MEPGYEETAFEPRPTPPPGSNGMGVAGFVVSLVGLVLCFGILCPLGLIFSLVGLGRQPRGLAIAGTVIGGVGSLLLMGLIAVFAVGMGEVKEYFYTGFAVTRAAAVIEDYNTREGKYPDDGEGRDLLADIRDGWNRPLEYARTETGYVIRSAGADGRFDTDDDLTHEP